MQRPAKGPGRKAEQIQSEMEELFRALVNRQRTVHHQAPGGWRPHLEVYETDRALVVRAELAGVEEGGLDVTVEDQILHLRGTRDRDPGQERRVFHQMEISYGPFAAEVFIPFAIDADRVEANHEGGILEVILPKTAPRRISPRTVPVAEQSPESGQETSR
jgi:HSP20 family protein